MSESTSPWEQSANADLTESERYRLLADEKRRILLDVLTEERAYSFDELVTQVIARGIDDADTEIDSREHVRIQLHHVHLPMMADLGVIEYDPKTNCVKRVTPPNSPTS